MDTAPNFHLQNQTEAKLDILMQNTKIRDNHHQVDLTEYISPEILSLGAEKLLEDIEELSPIQKKERLLVYSLKKVAVAEAHFKILAPLLDDPDEQIRLWTVFFFVWKKFSPKRLLSFSPKSLRQSKV